MDLVRTARVSVRELIVELSTVERALRRNRRPAAERGADAIDNTPITELVRREQQIVHELRRRARGR